MDMKYETFRVDLSQEGLLMIFKDWEAAVYMEVYAANSPIGSSLVHERLLRLGYIISRASVVNFLDRLEGAGVLLNKQITGKGGHRGQYSIKIGPEALMTAIMAEVAKKVETYLKG